MKVCLLFLSFLCFHTLFIYSQPSHLNESIVDIIDIMNLRHSFQDKYAEFDGSPFLEEEFVWGRIEYREEAPKERVPIRYNVYTDKIEFYFNGQIMELLAYPLVERVFLESRIFVFGSHRDGRNVSTGFYQLLVEGNSSLLQKYQTKLFDPVPSKPMQDAKPARFVPQPSSFFIETPEGELLLFNKVKELPEYFPRHRKTLLNYIKSEKISSRNTEELIRFFNFLNSLEP